MILKLWLTKTKSAGMLVPRNAIIEVSDNIHEDVLGGVSRKARIFV